MRPTSLGFFTFQSTPSVGRATTLDKTDTSTDRISIHALRGEGDRFLYPFAVIHIIISIHALRGEGDAVVNLPIFLNTFEFQSTPSVGRATEEDL